MLKDILKLNKLTENVCLFLEKELNYSSNRVHFYACIFRNLKLYMSSKGYKCYNKKIGKEFVSTKFKADPTKNQRLSWKDYENAVNILNQYKKTGFIIFPKKASRYPLKFEGGLAVFIEEFIEFKTSQKMSRSSIHGYQRNLFNFLKYCNKSNINTPNQIDTPVLLKYIKQSDSHIVTLLITLRQFTNYLYVKGYINMDYSQRIPREKKIQQPKIPSVYKEKEIKILLDSIDRSLATGKRNFAVVVLATRLGIRASDIANLKLDDINWHNSTISFYQIKTGKKIILPLFAEIGNAIIDYLKFGRPKSNQRQIFLTARPPYMAFTNSNIVTHIVQRAILKSDIKIKNRRFGPHSLRHSLASRLLEKSTAINVISEVLGHENSESTAFYLRIDLKSMQQCTLSVPAIPKEFYLQKAGIFYE
jgi:site-specific recombinase XerD